MVDVVISRLADQDIFVPTLIAGAPPAGEQVIGQALIELSCKYLAAGQALTMEGGYVVRGIRLQCNKRARAIRDARGAFDVVQPPGIAFTQPVSLAADEPATFAGKYPSIIGGPRC